MSMSQRRRARAGAVSAALSVAAGISAVGGIAPRAAAFDSTFNISLVGSFDPLGTPATTNNFYSDLSVEGNLVAIGSVATTGVCVIDNTNPAAPTHHARATRLADGS